MKRLKIKGITGMPLFLTRFQGYLDGKCGAVVWRDDGWHSHYIENKRAIYDAFVHKLYTNLENQTSALRMESAELVVEHETVKKSSASRRQQQKGSQLQSSPAIRVGSQLSEIGFKPGCRKLNCDFLQSMRPSSTLSAKLQASTEKQRH